MTLGILLGMAMLTLYFGHFEEQQRNPNASPQSLTRQNSIEVALLQNRQGHCQQRMIRTKPRGSSWYDGVITARAS